MGSESRKKPTWVLQIDKETLQTKVYKEDTEEKKLDVASKYGFILNTGAANKLFLIVYWVTLCVGFFYVRPSTSWLQLLFEFGAAQYVASAGTGFFHLFLDVIEVSRLPTWMRSHSLSLAIYHFKTHHIALHYLTERHNIDLMADVAAGVPWLPFSVFVLPYPLDRVFLQASVYIVLAQVVHKYSHMANPPTFIKRLQKTGFILSRKDHNVHHTQENKNFCIFNSNADGFVNWIADMVIPETNWGIWSSVDLDQKKHTIAKMQTLHPKATAYPGSSKLTFSP